ncbi:hypothetical protein MRX96_042325 [Rhipicephalus microplus]
MKGRDLRRISSHPERFPAHKRSETPLPPPPHTHIFQTLVHKYRELSSRKRARSINKHSQHTFSSVPFTNDERRDTRLFYELEERDASGEQLAGFLASDVASPTL